MPSARDVTGKSSEEEIDKDAVALTIGLDRTTIPMEEKLRKGEVRDPALKRRKKPYVRKPPEPVEVNYRMGYVGTVSVIGVEGESIQTYKYGCSADVAPEHILKMMTDDLVHIQDQRRKACLPLLPLGIIQDGALNRELCIRFFAQRRRFAVLVTNHPPPIAGKGLLEQVAHFEHEQLFFFFAVEVA